MTRIAHYYHIPLLDIGSVVMENIRENRFLWQDYASDYVLQEVLLCLRLNKADKKLKIGEVPIEFDKRIYGESKRQLIPFIMSYIKTLFKLTAKRIAGK